MAGWILSAIVALSLVSIGMGALIAPRKAARQYGIELDDPRAQAFIRAMGVRDLAIGLLFAVLLEARARELLVWATLAIVPVAATDLLVVTRDRRATGAARGLDRARLLHGAGVIGLLGAAAVLLSGL